tara:strand:+ start:184 stop:339 length:156 start_codon:yes stop_codon:yes gene_type:complete
MTEIFEFVDLSMKYLTEILLDAYIDAAILWIALGVVVGAVAIGVYRVDDKE